jgi:hypothetical protein
MNHNYIKDSINKKKSNNFPKRFSCSCSLLNNINDIFILIHFITNRLFGFSTVVDGYFFPKTLPELFNAGEQAQVSLLLGWNTAESPGHQVVGKTEGDAVIPQERNTMTKL